MRERLKTVVGDLTRVEADVIVNAANSELARGGGVCGAIFRAAGARLDVACRALAPCPSGEARITPGFDSRATWIVHAVGPVWHGGTSGEDALLASAYRFALALGESVRAETIAFPAISTGTYGFPFERAAAVASAAVREWIEAHDYPSVVEFVFLSEPEAGVYERLLSSMP